MQVPSLKVNLKDFVKKAFKKIRLTVLSQFLTKIERLEKFGLWSKLIEWWKIFFLKFWDLQALQYSSILTRSPDKPM